MVEEKIITEVRENQDSIEFGKQSTGRLKVYGDFSKPDEFKKKVDVAIDCMLYMTDTVGKKLIRK